jgi:mRNA-degrading endonuclease RelE of RelBE toxin-antitoxin system
MSFEVSVKLDRAAVEDLQELGGFRARVLSRALQDELRTPTPSLSVKPIPKPDRQASKPDWQALQIGDYRIIYRFEDPDEQGQAPTHLVARILDRKDFDEILQEDRFAEALPSGDSSD